MKIFVGNLSTRTVEQDLRAAFSVFAPVDRVNIAMTSGHSRGFALIDLVADTDVPVAISGLNGSVLHGRRLRVALAHRREE